MGGPWHILVVEDNRDTANSMAQLLRLSGYSVDLAYDGLAGLAAGEAHWPDVVLLDIGLPGMNGYDVALALRAQNHIPRPTIIAITGYGTEESRKRSYESGIDYHMVKPVDPTELYETLDRVHCMRLGTR